MPAFGNVLTDAEIWAVLAYIKSRWPTEIRERQAEISRRAKGG
jgi:mono/diheme cytochrome c family protein